MTLQDITCFLKVAETLNYTKAAKELYISQPAVTKHIHSLEEEIGGDLIDRNIRRSIQLTEIGQILYDSLKQCSDIYNDAIQLIHLRTESAAVLVNLMRGTTFPDPFIEATTRYMEEKPSFRHFANFIEYDHFSTVLDRGEVLICSEDLMPSGKSYSRTKLTPEPIPYYIVASKRHRAFSNPDHVQLNEISKSALFLPEMLPPNVRQNISDIMQKIFGHQPKETIYLDSTDSVSLFLRSSECFTICTGWHTDAQSSEFRTIPIPMAIDYYAMWHTERLRNPEALMYINALRDSLREPAASI